MSLKKLESLLKVVETGSFSAAAELLGLTQSAVSRQIQALEEELGLALLHRHAGQIEPTPAGRTVCRRAERLIAEWDELLRESRVLAAGQGGVLRIGASSVPSTTLLPELLKRLRAHAHGVELLVATGDSVAVLAMLERHAIDAALVGMEPPPGRYRSLPVAEDELVVIGTDGTAALRETGDLLRYPLIVRERGSGTREALERLLREQGLDLARMRIAAEVDGTEAALALVRAGLGLSVVSRWTLPGEPERRGIRPLLRLPTGRRFYAVCPEGRETEPLLRLWLEEADLLRRSFTECQLSATLGDELFS